MFMIMYVSRNIEQASEMLDTWVKAGVRGVTILESSGLQQFVKDGGIREDIGIVVSLRSLLRTQEVHHRTLLSAIESQETLDSVIAAATEYVGDWDKPDVGVMMVWPLAQAFGLHKNHN